MYVSTAEESNAGDDTVKLARKIATLYQLSDNKPNILSIWNSTSMYPLELIPKSDFPVPESIKDSFQRGEALILETDTEIKAHFYLNESHHVLAISLPLARQPEQNIKIVLTLIFYAGIVIIVLVWVWPLILRLIALQDTLKRIGKGDLKARIGVPSWSYIKTIEREFNRMAQQIESLIEDNKLLGRAVSHNLKTPLARLRFGIEALTATGDSEKRHDYGKRVERDMVEMESLISTLLNYAQLEENAIIQDFTPISLVELVEQCMQSYLENKLHWRFEVEGFDSNIVANEQYLSILIHNLFSNAQRFAKSEVLVKVRVCTVGSSDQRIELSVEDDGPGIEQSERDQVIKPFWRGGNNHNASEQPLGGHGMGLAIVSRIAYWHNAKLLISKSDGLSGAKILVEFPLYKSS
ncbi:ATP-binding protein [Gilvimarinus sp. SDUM040013]|uniref:histidine kinase n=1 Tax=Gilvimarinus gilvus TaxID=3058038 RepID=A0ABU4RVM4_9GAMM|nr:ATP-binding protein [Gilvimarinus sp. SDUM040013]MDO3387636.1 ATP-binding protein [Gilvimarinus sp. SDUM040013]MDX6848923.1 ATP-binding protein [Gilvimarinus sp. SDUM040013]